MKGSASVRQLPRMLTCALRVNHPPSAAVNPETISTNAQNGTSAMGRFTFAIPSFLPESRIL